MITGILNFDSNVGAHVKISFKGFQEEIGDNKIIGVLEKKHKNLYVGETKIPRNMIRQIQNIPKN